MEAIVNIFHLCMEVETEPIESVSVDGSGHWTVKDNQHRKCTDLLCLTLFIATLITMTVLGGINIHDGQPELLLSGVNDQGLICGYDSAVINEPYFYSVRTDGIGVCVSSCPDDSALLTSTNPSDYYCLHDIVAAGLQTSDYISNSCFLDGFFAITSDCGCMIRAATVTSPLNRCRFTQTVVANQFVTQQLTGFLWTIASDIYTSRYFILAYGVITSVVLSLLYFWVQQSEYFEESFLFVNIAGLFGLFGCLCYFAYSTFHVADILFLQVVAVIVTGLAFILLLVIVSQVFNIQRSAKIISLSFKFMDTMMPAVFIIPVIKVLSLAAFFICWVFYVGYTASRCTFTTVTVVSNTPSYTYQMVQLGTGNGVQLCFLFFCFLWVTEFISAVGKLSLSTTVSLWYVLVLSKVHVYLYYFIFYTCS